jgi:hypothetical protein
MDPVAAAEHILRSVKLPPRADVAATIASPRYWEAPPDVSVRHRAHVTLLDRVLDVWAEWKLAPWWAKLLVYVFAPPAVVIAAAIVFAYAHYGR